MVWNGWRNPDDGNFGLPEFRFDAEQYEAEPRRAGADLGWERPARRMAGLLEAGVRAHPGRFAAWGCELSAVPARPWEPERIVVFLLHPGVAAVGDGRPWLRFRMTVPVTGDDPAEQAERLCALVTAQDPRRGAEVSGGSKEFADLLGHPWTPTG
ncbi:hypothetical protein ACFQ6U_36175 [Streptomyces sp. NPDC056465]|uniref:hypothetical protein n=1 Tax=Streptomyces sp. NPDC056465 TaxID=3345829 RepID=UPI0036B02377